MVDLGAASSCPVCRYVTGVIARSFRRSAETPKYECEQGLEALPRRGVPLVRRAGPKYEHFGCSGDLAPLRLLQPCVSESSVGCRSRILRCSLFVPVATRVAMVGALVATATTVMAAEASADVPSTISGTVTAAYGGGSLSQMCVSAFPAGDPSAPMVAGWRTADDGSYQLTLPAGTYQVSFDDCGTGSEYASQWWDHVADRSSASAVPVSSGEQVTGISAVLATQAPGLPGPVTAQPGVRQVSLSWTPPDNQGATPVTGYDIYRLSDPTMPRSLIVSNSPGTSYIDSGLADDTTYTYFVAAVNSARAGDPRSASARTFQAPLPPQSVTTDVINNSTISLGWPASFDGGDSPVTGYNVYRSTDPSSRGPAITVSD